MKRDTNIPYFRTLQLLENYNIATSMDVGEGHSIMDYRLRNNIDWLCEDNFFFHL